MVTQDSSFIVSAASLGATSSGHQAPTAASSITSADSTERADDFTLDADRLRLFQRIEVVSAYLADLDRPGSLTLADVDGAFSNAMAYAQDIAEAPEKLSELESPMPPEHCKYISMCLPTDSALRANPTIRWERSDVNAGLDMIQRRVEQSKMMRTKLCSGRGGMTFEEAFSNGEATSSAPDTTARDLQAEEATDDTSNPTALPAIESSHGTHYASDGSSIWSRCRPRATTGAALAALGAAALLYQARTHWTTQSKVG